MAMKANLLLLVLACAILLAGWFFSNPWFYYINGKLISRGSSVSGVIEALGEPQVIGGMFVSTDLGQSNLDMKEIRANENLSIVNDFETLRSEVRKGVGSIFTYQKSGIGFKGLFVSGNVILLFEGDELAGAHWETALGGGNKE